MSAVVLPADLAAAVARVARDVVSAGPMLDGAERRAVALASRAPSAHRSGSSGALHVAAVIATEAHTVRRPWIDDLAAHGINAYRYVEIVGVVARMRAVDTLCFALGVPVAELGSSEQGAPTGHHDERAAVDGGFVPTVGRAGAPNALSALPSEQDAMHLLHGTLYLTMEQMRDLDIRRGLHRSQMELVASRTSWLNDCFY